MNLVYRGGIERLDGRDSTRVWQIWPSRGNFIFLEGLCITGEHPILLVVIIMCAMIPFGSFMTNREPDEPWSLSVYFLCLWFVITIILILKVSLSDPGIIPRRTVAERIYGHIADRNEAENLIDPYHSVSGSVFCFTCDIWRPPQASHCGDCGNCILGLDHHCAVLNNCIGQRNYPFFLMLLPAVFFLTTSFIFQIKLPGYNDRNDINPGITYTVILSLSMLVAVSFAVFTFGLIIFHSWLAWTNKTTRQHLRNKNEPNTSFMERIRWKPPLFRLSGRLWGRAPNIDSIS